MPSKEQLEKEEFLKMLERYRMGTASPEEQEFLDAYYNMFGNHEDFPGKADEVKKAELGKSIHDQIRANRQLGDKPVVVKWRWLSVAAACLLLFSFSVYFFSSLSPKPVGIAQRPSKPDVILPGINKAILTLASGDKIILKDEHDEELIYKMIDTVKAASSAFNTVVTPMGTQYALSLPDGSKVWLNSGSSIRFPSEFNGAERKVEMTGEVYFEIAKMKNKPFIVSTGKQQVEVLGTHFNINAYTDEEQIKTTLLEGSVKVSGSDHKARILSPGQQSLITAKGDFIAIREADVEMAVAWKNGYFKFERQSLQEIMKQIARWYDVEVEYAGIIPPDEYVGKIKRSEDIADVLNILKLSKVSFKVEGRKIIINN